MKTRGCTFQKKTIKVSLRFTSEDLATIPCAALCPSSPGSAQPPPRAGARAEDSLCHRVPSEHTAPLGRGEPARPPSPSHNAGCFLGQRKVALSGRGRPARRRGEEGRAARGLRAGAGARGRARVRAGLTRRAAGISGSFPINPVPLLLSLIGVRLPKAPGEEPFPALTLFPISRTKGEGKGELCVYTHVHHTCARAERTRDTGGACIKMKLGFYSGRRFLAQLLAASPASWTPTRAAAPRH